MNKMLKEVKDIDLNDKRSVDDIIASMGEAGGFSGRYLADGLEIMKEMIVQDDCVKFLSFPAALVATGIRGVIKELVKRKYFDAVITTCGTLDHDLARSFAKYYKGDFHLDDQEVERDGYHRLGSILLPKESYGPVIENKLQQLLKRIYDSGVRSISSTRLSSMLGEMINDDNSILYWANKHGIPVIVPGITDGAVGNQIWFFTEKYKDFTINVLEDETILSDMTFNAKKSGALIVGGGISKHHTLWWNQFRGGLDYAVYITTAEEYDGSLSGAITKEAVSWGKISPNAKQVTIHADGSLVLPFLVAALIESK